MKQAIAITVVLGFALGSSVTTGQQSDPLVSVTTSPDQVVVAAHSSPFSVTSQQGPGEQRKKRLRTVRTIRLYRSGRH